MQRDYELMMERRLDQPDNPRKVEVEVTARLKVTKTYIIEIPPDADASVYFENLTEKAHQEAFQWDFDEEANPEKVEAREVRDAAWTESADISFVDEDMRVFHELKREQESLHDNY